MHKKNSTNQNNSNLDINFDDLAPKFSRKIYGGIKGKIRLAILNKDLSEFMPDIFLSPVKKPLSVLDAGGGYGPFSLDIALLGHNITICDISKKMLDIAEERINEKGVQKQTRLINASIQNFSNQNQETFDLVLCHAVIDWINNPDELLEHLLSCLKPEGLLSLTFYNIDGMILKNLLRTNYKKILKQNFKGWPGSLTPAYPKKPSDVIKMIENNNLKILCHSGMRVFHDYVLNIEDYQKDHETVVNLELEYSRQQPYRDIGRYQHILCRKNSVS